ncbi:MAG: AMP-binding protein [Candidatus Thermoplasmatota archaeon]|nr:AMP-binding protein [Candidatus Thermoplasmatota archaeon]
MSANSKYTLSNLLRRAAKEHPERIALYYDDRAITYGQLDELASRFASGLLKLGIEKGDRVGLYMPNYPEWIIAFFGISRMGGVVVPMNTRYRKGEVEYIMNNSEATALVMASNFLNMDYVNILDELRGKLPSVRRVIVLGERRSEGMEDLPSVIEMGKGHEYDERLHDIEGSISQDDVVFILYTSGTTGEPKGAMLTNLNISKNAEQIAQQMRQDSRDVCLIVVPFFHCFGCVIGISACVSASSGMVPMPSFNASEALSYMEMFGITIVHGVPTMFIEYLEEIKKRRYDLSNLRTGVMAGAPCPIEVMKGAIEQMGANIVIAYGLTESSPVITMTSLDDDIKDRVETVGRPLPEQEVRIVDENNLEVPKNVTGELVVRGYNVMKGYHKKEEATREAIDGEGFLHSGDLATMDERGFVRIVGRKKDMYISGGFNVYPREIEEFLFKLNCVENVAVLGVPDPKFGEVGLVAIKLKEGKTATAEDITNYCKMNLANFKVPRYVWFIDEYPMTQSGKVQKFRLRELAKKRFSLKI